MRASFTSKPEDKNDPQVARACSRQEGSALVVTVLLLVMVSALALTSMRTVAGDQMVAGYQKQEQLAFYAAEGGVAQARSVVRDMGHKDELPAYPADFPDEDNKTELGQNGDYYNDVKPSYYADPDVTDPIVYVRHGERCVEGCGITGTPFFHTQWKINVIGESPSGDTKKIELIATRLLSAGYM